jgi:hypothetical protein
VYNEHREGKLGAKFMEQCPKCKNWTVFYNPQSEEKICCTCNNREVIRYEEYIKSENISSSLLFSFEITPIKPLEGIPQKGI